ncbi:LytR C-terminal domain-containing protein [Amycolatopsis sp. WGS_07]|uniref:LytR C-terminal domain-containing protein n=1 Tax=Amycolatopsis sp. WGS_07 TaxID=3076764 RepID=UPI003872C274
MADKLAAAGYQRGSVSNSAARRTSTVYYGSGQRAQAERIAEKLGGVAVASDSSLEKDHFRVYLGQKYSDDSGVHPAAAPADPPPADITADGVTCVN